MSENFTPTPEAVEAVQRVMSLGPSEATACIEAFVEAEGPLFSSVVHECCVRAEVAEARVAELERELVEVKEECRSWAQNGERDHTRLQQATEALRAVFKEGPFMRLSAPTKAKVREFLAALAGEDE